MKEFDKWNGVKKKTNEDNKKRNKYYFEFEFIKDKKSVAILSQMRNLDAKRLLNKIGMISQDNFEELKKQLKEIID